MTDMNDIGILRQLNVSHIQKLLAIGVFASLAHFTE